LVCLAGVLSVCAWHHPLVYTAPVTPISILNLKGDAWWQESYLDNSDCLSARYASGDILALAPDGAVGCRRGQPSRGRLELVVAGGSAAGNTSVGGTGAVGAGDVSH
jgi:hypothetical protein